MLTTGLEFERGWWWTSGFFSVCCELRWRRCLQRETKITGFWIEWPTFKPKQKVYSTLFSSFVIPRLLGNNRRALTRIFFFYLLSTQFILVLISIRTAFVVGIVCVLSGRIEGFILIVSIESLDEGRQAKSIELFFIQVIRDGLNDTSSFIYDVWKSALHWTGGWNVESTCFVCDCVNKTSWYSDLKRLPKYCARVFVCVSNCFSFFLINEIVYTKDFRWPRHNFY